MKVLSILPRVNWGYLVVMQGRSVLWVCAWRVCACVCVGGTVISWICQIQGRNCRFSGDLMYI